jgi:NAD(P)-dependent dehydrogenase (short-subunit alcohol dehydrogenase family)
MDATGRKTVIVTGGSAGLGRAIAYAFAKRGANVALLARNPKALAAAVDECTVIARGAGSSGHFLAIPTDVSDPDAVEQAADRAQDELGAIDVWVNNAMVSVFSPVQKMEASDYRRVTEVLYLGFVHGTLAALRRMQPRDGGKGQGTIIQIGPCVSLDSAAIRLLRLQACHCRVHGLAAL